MVPIYKLKYIEKQKRVIKFETKRQYLTSNDRKINERHPSVLQSYARRKKLMKSIKTKPLTPRVGFEPTTPRLTAAYSTNGCARTPKKYEFLCPFFYAASRRINTSEF